jgi:carbonic anhydrase
MDIHGTVKNADILKNMTPEQALELLKEGNKRFLNKTPIERDHEWHIKETIDSQHPFAIILSCIDSRVEPSLIFDQGLGDLFIARIAGNIVNQDILGSMEYACAVTGSKLIVVLGHTSCGAVKGAVDDVKLGNLTAALKPIKLAVAHVNSPTTSELRNSKNIDFVNSVALKNVELSIEDIKGESPILLEMYNKKEIDIVGAMYNHATGEVKFL